MVCLFFKKKDEINTIFHLAQTHKQKIFFGTEYKIEFVIFDELNDECDSTTGQCEQNNESQTQSFHHHQMIVMLHEDQKISLQRHTFHSNDTHSDQSFQNQQAELKIMSFNLFNFNLPYEKRMKQIVSIIKSKKVNGVHYIFFEKNNIETFFF